MLIINSSTKCRSFCFFYPRSVFTIVYKCQSMENKDKCIKKTIKKIYIRKRKIMKMIKILIISSIFIISTNLYATSNTYEIVDGNEKKAK